MNTDQSPLTDISADTTISQITEADEQAAELLASIGLSLSKHKNETLRSVCQQRQWSEVEVLEWIKQHNTSANGSSSNGSAGKMSADSDLSEWIEYLRDTFIDPNRILLSELDEGFPRVHKIHGNQYSWLKEMQWHFNKLDETLKLYYEFEKNKFFPLIERLENQRRGKIKHGTIRRLQKSFSILKEDQDRMQRVMQTIRNKANQFEHPEGACSTLRIMNENFKALFSNLIRQFKVESEEFLPLVKEEIRSIK